MKIRLHTVLASIALGLVPTLSRAEDAPAAPAAPTATAPADPLSFNIGAVTDYRYRGISQTHLKPAACRYSLCEVGRQQCDPDQVLKAR
jgi:hypothetical protein